MNPPSSKNANAIANLLAAAQRGTDALMQAALGEQLVCDSCNHQFLAVLGMQTGGRSTIACPKCKEVVFTR
jgi:hypothetical protein